LAAIPFTRYRQSVPDLIANTVVLRRVCGVTVLPPESDDR